MCSVLCTAKNTESIELVQEDHEINKQVQEKQSHHKSKQ